MDAEEECFEVEASVRRDHDLAVEHAAVGEVGAKVRLELGEVAAERLEVAGLDVDLVSRLEDKRAKSVPLWLVDPLLSVGDIVGELREHRLDRRLKGQGQRPGEKLH